jgi:hypothetical protein
MNETRIALPTEKVYNDPVRLTTWVKQNAQPVAWSQWDAVLKKVLDYLTRNDTTVAVIMGYCDRPDFVIQFRYGDGTYFNLGMFVDLGRISEMGEIHGNVTFSRAN